MQRRPASAQMHRARTRHPPPRRAPRRAQETADPTPPSGASTCCAQPAEATTEIQLRSDRWAAGRRRCCPQPNLQHLGQRGKQSIDPDTVDARHRLKGANAVIHAKLSVSSRVLRHSPNDSSKVAASGSTAWTTARCRTHHRPSAGSAEFTSPAMTVQATSRSTMARRSIRNC